MTIAEQIYSAAKPLPARERCASFVGTSYESSRLKWVAETSGLEKLGD